MYGEIGADKVQLRRKRSKSSGSSLQVERGDKRKKKHTGIDKCQMREMAAGPEKEKKERKRKRNKLYYGSHRAAERVCVE